VSPLPGKLPPILPRKPGESGASPLPGKLPPILPRKPGAPRVTPALSKPKPEPKTSAPSVAKPGEADPFASMLSDDEDDIHELDELDELAPLDDDDGDDDLASSFGEVGPEPDAGRSGARKLPPPPPSLGPKKK
jgi:hypothetical protein